MGRGRAKAKQTKVARQLKYGDVGFDPSRLANELGASPSNESVNPEPFEDDDEDDDPYASYAQLYNGDEDDDEDEAAGSYRKHA
ncbi:DUF3073 domain-containing protein [Streptacidiphilus sp. P02-A3a]|jgi:hypothetical protein|uniref:DUF3073 domain-containing protein n=1 Tax=Streptacidiphilus sp. P02-A3a TaxID=2704468 RepID=UPI0015F8AB30|nr:DUF3073 domain-containing protein [Streptacidiphilus sp. P02-A3a]QMU73290.1 DUF3073 domain-containing protein [Streptacidiphilus sp. P02-A3a]